MKKIINIVAVAFATLAVVASATAQSAYGDQSVLESTPTVNSYTTVLKMNSSNVSPFVQSAYFGVGAGTAFGVATFGTVGIEKTTPRVSAQIFGGYEFSRLLSAELSVGYTNLNMTTAKGTQYYYISEGMAAYIPSPDAEASGDYALYSDLKSKSDLISVEAKFNINLMALSSYKSDWGFLITPKIGYAYSSSVVEDYKGDTYATFKSLEQTSSHISLGFDFSGEYSFNNKTSLRLTTGVNYLSGDGIDGIPQVQYESNYVWTTTLNFVYRLGK